jgi:hypothetical protein
LGWEINVPMVLRTSHVYATQQDRY